MAKKSRKTAARYSELSKAKKKKQRDKPSEQTGTVSVSTSQSMAEPAPVRSTVPKAVPRPQAELKRGISSYQYVRADLKRIGILAGAMILILIIVSFALG
jgi:hypothetical protein